MDGLFFAFYPDARVAEEIYEFSKEFIAEKRLKMRPVAPGRLHVTLAYLGEFEGLPADRIARARRAADQVTMPVFTTGFDKLVHFAPLDRTGPLVLLAADEVRLHELRERLVAALALEAIHLPTGFTPHMTLSYDRTRIEPQSAGRYNWRVDQFVLMHSLIGQSRHIPLGRWALRAESAQT